MPTLLEYINQLQQEHRYRIKMAFQPSDRHLEVLERHMKKYDALEVSRPEKLMLQSQPMDFPQLSGHEIVIVDVVTRLPISPPTLESELRGLLFVREGVLKVFSRNDPFEQQIEEEKLKSEYSEYMPLIGADAEVCSTPANKYGDRYNQETLDAADKAGKERKANITQNVGKITSGPDYTGPTDGKISPIGTKQNNIAVSGKGDKK